MVLQIIFATILGLSIILWIAICCVGFGCVALSDRQAKFIDISLPICIVLFIVGLIGLVVALCLS